MNLNSPPVLYQSARCCLPKPALCWFGFANVHFDWIRPYQINPDPNKHSNMHAYSGAHASLYLRTFWCIAFRHCEQMVNMKVHNWNTYKYPKLSFVIAVDNVITFGSLRPAAIDDNRQGHQADERRWNKGKLIFIDCMDATVHWPHKQKHQPRIHASKWWNLFILMMFKSKNVYVDTEITNFILNSIDFLKIWIFIARKKHSNAHLKWWAHISNRNNEYK